MTIFHDLQLYFMTATSLREHAFSNTTTFSKPSYNDFRKSSGQALQQEEIS